MREKRRRPWKQLGDLLTKKTGRFWLWNLRFLQHQPFILCFSKYLRSHKSSAARCKGYGFVEGGSGPVLRKQTRSLSYVYQSARGAETKYRGPDGLSDSNLFLNALEAGKSRIKVQLRWVWFWGIFSWFVGSHHLAVCLHLKWLLCGLTEQEQ